MEPQLCFGSGDPPRLSGSAGLQALVSGTFSRQGLQPRSMYLGAKGPSVSDLFRGSEGPPYLNF
jgi:hypothetical protein